MAYGKLIELYLVNGTADSIVIAERLNWSGKAIKIPRMEVAECQKTDIQGPGVYFLFCPQDDQEKDAVYIGESENLKKRLMQHIQDYNSEKEKYYWNTAVLLSGRELNKAFIRYLEDQFVQKAKAANRYDVLTKSTYGNTTIKESYREVLDEFLEHMQILMNALGCKVLEPMDASADKAQKPLQLEKGNAHARGQVTAEGFLLLKGARINENTNPNLPGKLAEKRDRLIHANQPSDYTTKEDMLFSSATAAAEFVLGYIVSGPQVWKNESGTPLKDLQM